MQIFEEMQARGHEALTLLHHAPSGLKAALAVHSTVLGPAIAGVRLRPLEEGEALRGALALSESLTLKAALAGLNYGGGACVLLLPEGGVDDPHAREALFRALGRQVRPLESRVVLTEDIGVTPTDIAFVAQETPATLGVNTDTSSVTGYGVYRGMKAAARYALGSESMRGVRVALLGVGAVGRALAEHLHREGARLTVADTRPERAQALAEDLDGVSVVSTQELFDVPCDILAPCGYGHSIRSADVPRLQCRLIAGGEHHPLSRRGEGAVREAGIVYMPDFAINAAGLIAAATNLTPEQAAERVYATVSRITAAAEQYGKPPHIIARRMAERRIDLIGSLGAGAGTYGRSA
ncbi:branched-chain amino acid dehydrogenase [Deinococcus sp. RL]|uniref:Glu/Leu/Phe/Val dehydrogenase family protein n=1 Tax=Deinococcus sp. RL TaxID=1489678 RepID=UPI0004DB1AA2|nr:Glu/Leu/Phe/Val dehydrogenase dimerization domain-containing protein [Deinococcus sp. RL]KEF33932.1 branched-chain amino acid dehydrogenase [Deinococcus sp. RL]